MKVIVTERHIKAGKRGDCWNCPIALAICDVTGLGMDAYRVMVLPARATVGGTRYELPAAAKTFVADFDDKEPVSPFVFELKELAS